MAEAAGASPEDNPTSEGMKSILSFDPSQVESDPDATRKTVEREVRSSVCAASLFCYLILGRSFQISWTRPGRFGNLFPEM